MTWVDYVVLAVVVLSTAWGLWHGLVREVISLAGWVIGFLAANLLAGPVGERLPDALGSAQIRILVAFVVVFILALAMTTLAGVLLSKMLRAAGLAGLDRTLGGLFGLARAALLILALALAAGLTALPRHPSWTASLSGPWLARLSMAVKPWLPPALSERLRYH
ncbi:MAG TPA: CvpA family protein [Burkholderiales bacterium]|nr:CvpA family protein [Burkholderiales bacterium]